MLRKRLSLAIAVIGLLVSLASLLAGVIGIGGVPGVGVRHTVGAVAGFVFLAIGMAMWPNPDAGPPDD